MNNHPWHDMWETQRLQQEQFGQSPVHMNDQERNEVAKDLALGLMEEATELNRQAINFKAHLLKRPPIDRGNIVDGIVDVLKYTIALAQLFGLDSETIHSGFRRKSQVVADRALGERLELSESSNVIISDLDGCLVDLSSFTDKLVAAKDGKVLDDELVSHLETLKTEFYESGKFRFLPAIPGAREACREIKAKGYKLILITARPYWQYKRIYDDTLFWLQAQGIEHDLLLFNKDKADAIIENIFPARPKFFVEDRDKHSLELANIGIKVLLLDKKYNRTLPEHPLIERVNNWDEIREKL